jgi:dTDP-6-deoxy-L-talose 4-dehydrogenase (NAD+)
MVKGGLRQIIVMGTMHEVGYWEGEINDKTPTHPTSLYGVAKDALRKSGI